jgi:hypothetical protein
MRSSGVSPVCSKSGLAQTQKGGCEHTFECRDLGATISPSWEVGHEHQNSLVALWMTRALEALDATLRRMEQGEIDAWRLDRLLIEELNVRANRRVRWHSLWHRLTAIKSLAGFDFAFRPHSTDSASWHWPS